MLALVSYQDFVRFKMVGVLGETLDLVPWIALTVLFGVIAYLIGSISFSVIISKLKYHEDVRDHGSHNAGATNMLRTYGTKMGVIVLILDFLKGVLAFMLAQAFVGESGACIAGVMYILGHCYPIYYKFKGGKGVATSIAVLLMMEPFSAAACILVFLVLVIGTRYISLGSVGAAFLAPVFVDSLYRYSHMIVEEVDGELVAKAIIPTPFQTVAIVIIALLVIFKHRANIKRLVNGEENKFSFKKSEK